MKRDHLSKLALMGVFGAIAVNGQVIAAGTSAPAQASASTPAAAPMTADQQNFSAGLSASAQQEFQQLSSADRDMSMRMAQHGCKGKNECKGQGGCKSDKNACKGQNSCKGQGTCKMTADQAVHARYEMAQKRAAAQNS